MKADENGKPCRKFRASNSNYLQKTHTVPDLALIVTKLKLQPLLALRAQAPLSLPPFSLNPLSFAIAFSDRRRWPDYIFGVQSCTRQTSRDLRTQISLVPRLLLWHCEFCQRLQQDRSGLA